MTDITYTDSAIPTLIIRPPRKWVPVDLHELWNYGELLTSFTMRDIKIRYKQTAPIAAFGSS